MSPPIYFIWRIKTTHSLFCSLLSSSKSSICKLVRFQNRAVTIAENRAVSNTLSWKCMVARMIIDELPSRVHQWYDKKDNFTTASIKLEVEWSFNHKLHFFNLFFYRPSLNSNATFKSFRLLLRTYKLINNQPWFLRERCINIQKFTHFLKNLDKNWTEISCIH